MPDQPIATLAKKTADARRVLAGSFASDLGVKIALDLMGIANPAPENWVYARHIAQTHHDTLARSMLFLADEDMVDLLDTAAPSMPDQELAITDFIAPDGFVFCAKPLPDRSGVPPEVPIRALSWAYLPADSPLLDASPPGEAVLITAYVDLAEVARARGLLDGDFQIAPNMPRYIANATVVWTVGSLIGQVFGGVPPEGPYTPGFYQRVLAAFWTLAQQPKMTSTIEQPPGRPADQRRYKRAGIANPTAPVHVVRLHHRAPETQTGPAGATGAESGRKVGVRFPVRGFWRRQWYASVQQHRHIWIDPHWRGPEDAPVVGGERVFLAHGTQVDPGAD